jgi:hypothetical protein
MPLSVIKLNFCLKGDKSTRIVADTILAKVREGEFYKPAFLILVPDYPKNNKIHA